MNKSDKIVVGFLMFFVLMCAILVGASYAQVGGITPIWIPWWWLLWLLIP